jgi:hypothetical protein
MTDLVLFRETQTFRKTWIWLILLPINAVFIYVIYEQFILGQLFGGEPSSAPGFLFGFFILVVVNLLIYSIRLETSFTEDGIQYRFFPIESKMKSIAWDDISKAYVREYRPIAEYGGWGMRFGIFGKGMAYNVSGNMGIQLELTSGKKILFGTQEAGEIERILRKLKIQGIS